MERARSRTQQTGYEVLLPPQHVHLNNEMVTNFFLVFSRFEYALKRAKCVSVNKKGHVKPNWSKFAQSIESLPWNDAKLAEAADSLQRRPPKRQIVNSGGGLDWEKIEERDDLQRDNSRNIPWLLDMVQVVRNNLFHGGKQAPEPARDQELLKNSMIVLAACLDQNPEVKKYYEHLDA